MRKIIIYGSKYGTTKKYALELSKKTNIKAVSFKDIKEIDNYDLIIYLGALYAGGVLGMAKTLSKITNISNKNIILATVGLSNPEDKTNIENINNGIKKELPETILNKIKIFHLRGGIDYNKLDFMHKTMMKLLYTKAKSIKEEEKTEEIKDLINTYNKRIDFTNFSSLDKIITEIDKIKT